MTNISKLSWTGIARESVAGTAISTPTMYVPVKSKFESKTKYVYRDEDRATRDGNNRRIGSVRMASIDLSGAVYLTNIPYYLLAFMGGVTSTQPDSVGAPTAYQHALALVDQPPSFTLFKGFDHTGYYYAYSVSPKFKLHWAADNKALEFESAFEGQYRVKIGSGAYTAMTPTYAEGTMIAGYAPTIKRNGSPVTDIEDIEIEVEQKITLYYSSRGNRGFLKADFGERKASVKFTGRFDDATSADQFDNETDDAIIVEFLGANLGGTVVEKLNMTFPVVGYDAIVIDQSKEAQLVKYTGVPRPGATKNSLFTATVVNTTASYAS